MRRLPWGAVFVLTCISIARIHAIDLPGGVAVEGREIKWGQYRHLKGLISVEFPRGLESDNPADSFSERLRRYPASGVSSVLLRAQRPGSLFFSPDGASISKEERNDLADQLEALNRFDMLPIVSLFNPDPSCRLQSEEAYTQATETFVKEFSGKNWYLLCVSERCDSQEWEKPFSIPMLEIALRGAERLGKAEPDLVVGAGARERTALESLAANKALSVLFREVNAQDLENEPEPVAGWNGPVVRILSGRGLTDRMCYSIAEGAGMPRLGDEFPHGFAIQFDDSPETERLSELDALLGKLRPSVDQFQKDISNALPPDEEDTHSLKPGEAEEGFVSLFNGKDLSGWVPITKPNDFVVKEGVIQLVGKEGGWLRSWNSYSDYVFRGEYWIVDRGNSGFFMRAPLAGRESRIGFEFQIGGELPTDPRGKESTGSIYYVRPPDGNFIEPGEWNEVEIACVGTHVRILWNGELAHDFTYEEIDFMKNRSREGHIGLQDHHNFVKFRNLRIKKIE